jgi:hypothetical protein
MFSEESPAVMAEKPSDKTRKSTSRKKAPAAKAANVTPINQGGNSTGNVDAKPRAVEPTMVEQIRFRAYELFVERGRLDGFDQDDWARAEAEIRAKFQQEKSA